MLIIPCPHCGDRFESEFAYGGDATVKRPDDPADAKALFEATYLRDNPRGDHLEWWHHVSGCRAWIRVARNTLDNRISGAWPATGPLSGGTGA